MYEDEAPPISYGSLVYSLRNYTINYDNCQRFYNLAMCCRTGFYCFSLNIRGNDESTKQIMNVGEIIWIRCIMFTETFSNPQNQIEIGTFLRLNIF